jgi:hypothetical protein
VRRKGKRRESEYTFVYNIERLFAREFISDFPKSLMESGLRRKIFFGSVGEKKGLGGCFGFLVVRDMSVEKNFAGAGCVPMGREYGLNG